VTPAELIEKALREHLRIRLGERAFEDIVLAREIVLFADEAEDAARIAVDELAGAGFSVVSTGDLRAYLYRGKDLKSEVEAMTRLREIAGPERTDHA
jgi:hypothetical protein